MSQPAAYLEHGQGAVNSPCWMAEVLADGTWQVEQALDL